MLSFTEMLDDRKGEGIQERVFAVHAINDRFSFTEKERWDDIKGKLYAVLLFIHLSGFYGTFPV